MKVKKSILLIVLVVLGLSLSGQLVGAKEYNYFAQIENSNKANDIEIVGLGYSGDLGKNYRLETRLGFGDLFTNNRYVKLLNLNLYKKLNLNQDYYLGANYKYFYDENSSFKQGGEFTSNLFFITLKGFNQISDYLLYSEIGYAPLGVYEYQGEYGDMNGWKLKIGVETMILDNIYLDLSRNIGEVNYGDYDTKKESYSIGINYKL